MKVTTADLQKSLPSWCISWIGPRCVYCRPIPAGNQGAFALFGCGGVRPSLGLLPHLFQCWLWTLDVVSSYSQSIQGKNGSYATSSPRTEQPGVLAAQTERKSVSRESTSQSGFWLSHPAFLLKKEKKKLLSERLVPAHWTWVINKSQN